MRASILAVLAAVIAAIAIPAVAAPFSPPVQLSQNNYASMASVGIDDGGNALAIWADSGMFFADKPAGGNWSAPQSVYPGGSFPMLALRGDGAATIVSYSSLYGIWSIDRPPGGSWSAPYLIVDAPDIVSPNLNNVSPVQFLSNARGDQAIVFEQYVSGDVLITVLYRPSGGAWGGEDNAVSSADDGHIALSSAALGDDGDIVVTFETFNVVCSRYCHDTGYAVHAMREAAGTTRWIESGALTPASSAYNTRTVIDSAGRAGLLIQNGFSATIQATTQSKAGGSWSTPVNALTGNGSDGAQIWVAQAGGRGRANLAFDYLANPGGGITVLDGNLADDSWPISSLLSATDNPGANDNVVFDANKAGGAVAAWTDVDGTVRAALRKRGSSAWGAPKTIVAGSPCDVGGVVCTGTVSAAVNAHGQAIIAYIRLDPSVTYRTLFVATH